MRTSTQTSISKSDETLQTPKFCNEIRKMIADARSAMAFTVNAELTMLYWNVGKRIPEEILACERAEYGKQIVLTLSTQLIDEYGRGWSNRNLNNMIRFSDVFQDRHIAQSLTAQLTWTHIHQLI